jgi:hypothetical protein
MDRKDLMDPERQLLAIAWDKVPSASLVPGSDMYYAKIAIEVHHSAVKDASFTQLVRMGIKIAVGE